MLRPVQLWIIVLVLAGAALSENAVSSAAEETMDYEAHARQAWKDMEGSLRSTAEEAVKKIFPTLLRASNEAGISEDCQAAVFKVIIGVRKLKEWAISMVDASGKVPTGVLTGAAASLGSYDQCMTIGEGVSPEEVEENDIIVGQYCTVNIRFPILPRPYSNSSEIITDGQSFMHWVYNYGRWLKYFPIRIGACVPTQCSKDDLYKLAVYAAGQAGMKADIGNCESKATPVYKTEHVIILVALGTVATCVVIGTVLERVYNYQRKHLKPGTHMLPPGVLARIFLAFSFVANTKKLLNPRKTRNSLGVLHGLRIISCFWIVLGHTYYLVDIASFIRYRRLKTLEDLYTNVPFTVIENFLPVDTFFFISGLLIIYSSWGKLEQNKGKFNVLSSFLQRIWRMTPSYLLAIALFLLLPLAGSGPFWNETMEPLMNNCRNSWWTNALYVSNYLPYEKMCLLHTWFQAVNMQYYIVSLPLLLLTFKYNNIGLSVIFTLATLSALATGLVTYFFDLPPALLLMASEWTKALQQLNLVYFQPFTHFGPFCVGLFCGYYLVKNKEVQYKPLTLVIGWAVALIFTTVSLFGVYPYRANIPVDTIVYAVYAGVHRTMWCLGVAWITVVCETGHGGLINGALSWHGLVPVSNLTYLIYLLHPLVVYAKAASTREIINLDHLTMCYEFMGHSVIAIMLAFIAYVAVEQPFAALKDIVFRRKPRSPSVDIPPAETLHVQVVSNGHTTSCK
ncbi:nose resistant to fluoxetine protein 6-like [Ornithodoros turicata]|uniref:nose resistant to fluoxetine protein 6-like n=1 Tax=Ornithodoros turicata TaxID=34597 RepID=UPI00313936C8